MPAWRPIQRTWDALRSRYDLRHRIGEMLDGVIPTVVAERHWTGEELSVYGINALTDQGSDLFHGATPHHLYIELEAGALEVLIWAIHAQMFFTRGPQDVASPILTTPVHLFTPLQDYGLTTTAPPNGLEPNTVQPALHFSWLQPSEPSGAGLLANSLARAGGIEGQQTVSVNGIPTTSIGPIWQAIGGHGFGGNLVAASTSGAGMPLQGWQSSYAPPLRLKPGGRIAVQTTTAVGDFPFHLEANFIFSERTFVEGR